MSRSRSRSVKNNSNPTRRSLRKRRSLRNKRTPSKSKKPKKNSTTDILKVNESKFGWSSKVRNKNFNKFVLNAHKQGVKTIHVDNYPDRNDIYNVNSTVKKIQKNQNVLKY